GVVEVTEQDLVGQGEGVSQAATDDLEGAFHSLVHVGGHLGSRFNSGHWFGFLQLLLRGRGPLTVGQRGRASAPGFSPRWSFRTLTRGRAFSQRSSLTLSAATVGLPSPRGRGCETSSSSPRRRGGGRGILRRPLLTADRSR